LYDATKISERKHLNLLMKTPLKTLPFLFILALLSSSLHAQQTTTVVRIVDGDTLKIRYWGKDEGEDENKQ
jgi:endonuclease YncB( thermonuclease family)